jgi:peptide/nickel transport system substrate-binding protein
MNTSPRGRRTRRRAVFAGAAAIVVSALGATPALADGSSSPSAPASSAGSPAASAPSVPAGSKTFTIGILQDDDSLNPFSGFLVTSAEIYADTYDDLQNLSAKDLSPTPGLATKWEHTADGLTWTFTIRQGVKFSDGEPLTPDDVVYTYNRTLTDDTANAQYSSSVQNIKSVELGTDPNTVVFHMSAPDPVMEDSGVPILPKHIWENVSAKDTGTFENTAMVGTGPFVMQQWAKGQFIKLKANKNYWGGAPKIDYLVYRVFDDEDAEIQALRKGEIDAVDALSPSNYDALKGAKGLTRIAAQGVGFDELGFNTGTATVDGAPVGNGNPAGKDPKFRQAVAAAIDLKGLTDKVLQGHGQVGASIMPPVFSEWSYAPGDGAYQYDPVKAGQMLDAAGYTKAADGNRIDPVTHKEMNLRFDAPNDDPVVKQAVAFVQGYLQAVGIKTTTQLVDEDKLTDLVANGEDDIYMWGWSVSPDPTFQLSTMTCDQRDTGTAKAPVAGWSDSYYCNPAYDALYKQQSVTVDPTQRKPMVEQMQQMLYQDAPYIVLFYPDDLEAYNSKWTGIVQQPAKTGQAFFQFGTYTNQSVDLKSNTASTSTKSGGINPFVWVGIALAVVVVVGGVLLGVRRRRSTADERE